MTSVSGIVLAAGAGTRMGMPKALMRTADDESWLARATTALAAAGCDPVIAVLGAGAALARELVPPGVDIVVADNWADGMSASLRAGLTAARGDAALITLVDLPDLPLAALTRVLAGEWDNASSLRQAVYNGEPGHPVFIGRDHFEAVSESLTGDAGARRYLLAHGVVEVECADLFDGRDRDTPLALPR